MYVAKVAVRDSAPVPTSAGQLPIALGLATACLAQARHRKNKLYFGVAKNTPCLVTLAIGEKGKINIQIRFLRLPITNPQFSDFQDFRFSRTASVYRKQGEGKAQGRGSQNGSKRTTKQVKICLDKLRRGLPESRSHPRRQDKAEMAE